MLRQLLRDEAGFIVSAEMILIGTLLVIGLIVGLSQIQHAVVEESNDVAHAIGSLNQSFLFTGFSAEKDFDDDGDFTKSATSGGGFADAADSCDFDCAGIACDDPVDEDDTSFALSR